MLTGEMMLPAALATLTGAGQLIPEGDPTLPADFEHSGQLAAVGAELQGADGPPAQLGPFLFQFVLDEPHDPPHAPAPYRRPSKDRASVPWKKWTEKGDV